MAGVPVRAIKYQAPRGATTGSNVPVALKANLIPVLSENCQMVAIRCAFDMTSEGEARKQVAARRRQLEKKALEHSEVRCYFSIIFLDIEILR